MTREQFAVKVLSKLGKYDRSTLDPADLENVNDAYDAVYLVLADDGLVSWAVTDDVPNRFSLSLINLVKAEIADFYNIPEPREGWDRFKLSATNNIRRQMASGQNTEPVKAEYF